MTRHDDPIPGQIDLLAAPAAKVRHDARPTSRGAADAILGRTGTARVRVLEHLVAHPSTDDEMQEALRMNPNTQRPRRVELVDYGYVEPSGVTRRTPSGTPAVVWCATLEGHLALARHRHRRAK